MTSPIKMTITKREEDDLLVITHSHHFLQEQLTQQLQESLELNRYMTRQLELATQALKESK